MPIIKTETGNLLNLFKQDNFTAIVHGCNCFHTMGSGIAGQISDQFPESQAIDRKTKFGDITKLGKYSHIICEFGNIINLYTQFRPGREIKPRLYHSIEEGFTLLNHVFQDYDGTIGIPRIGAGIAGGDWKAIHRIIDGVTDNLNIMLVEWDGK